MTNLTRCALAALAMTTLVLGCNDDPPSGPDGGGSNDAGYEWDGTYTPLEEKGDSIDKGPFAACSSSIVNDAGMALPCGSPETFNLSACDRSTLSRLSPDGIYGLRVRSSSTFFGYGFYSFQISSAGGAENFNTYPLVEKQVSGQNLYVSAKRTLTDGGTTLWAIAGCQAQDAQSFTGCYQTCTNGGARRTSGTFDGTRLQRLNEPETSGIDLVSEAKVELGLPVDIYVAKNHAYVVSVNQSRPTPVTGGLTVFDVTDKGRPVLRKVVTLAGDGYWNAVWAKGDALYVGSGNHGVLVFDITDPADPKMVRGVPGDTFDVHTIYVDGDRMYAQAAGANQVLIFDVSKPLEPVLLNRYTVPADDNGLGYPHDSFAYQNRLYINQMGQGYYVLDVTDAANPKSLGAYTYDAHLYNPTHANAVGTFAGRTIAFEGGENTNAHLRVLDVTDPTRITKIGEYAMRPQTSIHNMLLVGKRLYVAWYAEGVRVLDVSNPTQPRELAFANTFRDSDPGRTGGLFVGAIGIRVPGDGYVYVVDTTRGLLIYREP
jgi:hypothetical protein